MKKIILTSAGFENKEIENKFLEMLNKPVQNAKVLWIPTAAISEDAKSVLSKCMNDLLNAGVNKCNIIEYNLDRNIKNDELSDYDAIYVCGGDCSYLLNKMNEDGFKDVIESFINNGGIYIGVSAGSIVCVNDFDNNLGFLPCTLDVHCEKGTNAGDICINEDTHINLTNNQAIIVEDNKTYIIG